MEIMCKDLFRSLAVVVLTGSASLALAVSASARSQEPQPPAESIVYAVGNARKQASNSTSHTTTITNRHLTVESPVTSAATNPAEPPAPNQRRPPTPQPA